MHIVTKMPNVYYAKKIALTVQTIDEIEAFVYNGTPVILCNDLEDLETFGIYEDDEDEVVLVVGE
jgi:hypothetical protein